MEILKERELYTTVSNNYYDALSMLEDMKTIVNRVYADWSSNPEHFTEYDYNKLLKIYNNFTLK